MVSTSMNWSLTKAGPVGVAWEITEKTVRYWYSDDPSRCEECQGVLRFIQVEELSGNSSLREEYVYKDGRIIFHFMKKGGEAGKQEVRTYFDHGLIFKLQLNDQVFIFQDAIDRADPKLRSKAEGLQASFLASFN